MLFEKDRPRLGSGSAFLVEGGLVTNSHVIRLGEIDAILIRIADTDPNDPDSYIRMLPEACHAAIRYESPSDFRDFAFLQLAEPEFAGRHRFTFDREIAPRVAQQVAFLGFPFGMPQLTAHIGHISSIHQHRGIRVFQIDGSVNGGNSGGPLINERGNVIGIVTRAVTGLIEEQFKKLIIALQQNQETLQAGQGRLLLGSIDPFQALRASQSAMEQIAKDLHRSANVGIGYAYSAEYIGDEIEADRGFP